MTYKKQMIIGRKVYGLIEGMLSEPPDPDTKGKTARLTAPFENGMQMDVSCFPSSDPTESGWTQASLFTPDGKEIASTEPAYEFTGEWVLEDKDGNTYAVDVVLSA